MFKDLQNLKIRIQSYNFQAIKGKTFYVYFVNDRLTNFEKIISIDISFRDLNKKRLLELLRETKSKEKIFSLGLESEFIFIFYDDSSKFTVDFFREKAYAAAVKCKNNNFENFVLILPDFEEFKDVFVDYEHYCYTFLEESYLGFYEYKAFGKEISLPQVYINAPDNLLKYIKKSFENYIKGIYLARHLANAPSNIVYPSTFDSLIKKIFKEFPQIKVKSLSDNEILKNNLQGILSVGKGSNNKPRLLILKKENKNFTKNIVLIGKGVTFDSGGISLKPSANMSDMKADLSGAAVIAGIFYCLSQESLNYNLYGILPLVESMPSGSAIKPGDTIRYSNGFVVEVEDTDAEGRLILADALLYSQKFKPDIIIDVATLTGAAVVALGEGIAALFSNNRQLADELLTAGNQSSELLWNLPLHEKYYKYLDTKTADIKNFGGRWGGAITAALFLYKFVPSNSKWAHIDIAGPALKNKILHYAETFMSGFGTRLLHRFLLNLKSKN